MIKYYAAMLVVLCAALSLGASDCGPTPTRSQFTEQRKVPFFKVLVYEEATMVGGSALTLMLFEDESGGCYITSGTDGGIMQLRDRTACDKAKAPALETKMDWDKVTVSPISARTVHADEITDESVNRFLNVTLAKKGKP